MVIACPKYLLPVLGVTAMTPLRKRNHMEEPSASPIAGFSTVTS
jgi:hypothetical protein